MKDLLTHDQVAKMLNMSSITLSRIRADKSKGFPEVRGFGKFESGMRGWYKSDITEWQKQVVKREGEE